MKKNKIAILTGGGDVQPLNIVIENVKKICNDEKVDLIGFLEGWKGIIDEKYVLLNNKKFNYLVGGTILKSSRVNLKNIPNAKKIIHEKLKKIGVEGLIVIGGEDTLSNSLLIDVPQVLISKTIDNDVGKVGKDDIINSFTLGHPTASEKISSFVSLKEGVRTTAYSHKRIIIVESMGMHAGWLAMSSVLGNPDFIIIPEFPLDEERFINLVYERFSVQENVIVVVSEGAKWKNGEHISADKTLTDDFGHPKFLGAASKLSEFLKNKLNKYIDTRNINYVNPSYLYRSGIANDLDKKTAKLLGKEAATRLIYEINDKEFLAINNKGKDSLQIEKINFDSVNDIESFHRFIPKDFYNEMKFYPTEKYIKYIQKINLFKDFDYREYLLN